MAKTVSALATGMAGGNATTIGAAFSPTATAAEITGLAQVLAAMGKRFEICTEVIGLAHGNQKTPVPTGYNQVAPG